MPLPLYIMCRGTFMDHMYTWELQRQSNMKMCIYMQQTFAQCGTEPVYMYIALCSVRN